MKKTISVICFVSLAFCAALYGQSADNAPVNRRGLNQGAGRVIVPTSSIARPEDLGERMRTHFLIFVPNSPSEEGVNAALAKSVKNAQPAAGYNAETPASLACLYGETTWTAGCNPAKLAITAHATGGARSIAIVDAYDDPNAAADLAAYSTFFGLPAATFTKVYASGTNPGPDPTCANGNGWNCWAAEESLDIEMVHAMAPSAHIYLVEAATNLNTDLFVAVAKAVSLLTTSPNTGGEVSMSYGGREFSGETSDDSNFAGANVVFFASTGDREGTEYPSTSPNVVAVGGTTLSRDPYNYNIEAEISWEDGAGGYSLYEPEPAYQNVVFGTGAGYTRAVPDVSAVGNPRTGVWVYDSFDTPTGANAWLPVNDWMIFGGTSVASPLWAGVVNHAGHFSASTTAEHTLLYGNTSLNPNLRDITYGSCGYYQGWFAVRYWDPCTGLGSPYGTAGK